MHISYYIFVYVNPFLYIKLNMNTVVYPLQAITIDNRKMKDKVSAIVVYDNPYDNVHMMAHHFFSRCLEAKVTPYVTTKKTVFKWQESFWQIMKKVFDEHYKEKFNAAGLLAKSRGELGHFLSDVATMHVVRWNDGGWGMAAHNYDGDVLTDEIAQVHRSPGFLTSVLNGVNDDGSIIKEFEASHGTVTDMYHAHKRGEETSLNPLSMMEALIGAMNHSALLHIKRSGKKTSNEENYLEFSKKLQQAIHTQMTTPGKASRDLSGPSGLTTEQFVKAVRERLESGNITQQDSVKPLKVEDPYVTDKAKMREMFDSLDTDHSGKIDFDEFVVAMKKLGIAPRKL
jgi:isocitrate dehydrogenase